MRSDKKQASAKTDIRIKASKIHGRGVFATRNIGRGRILARDPVLVVKVSANDEITRYVFAWNRQRDAIALGMISLINHSDIPNCEVRATATSLILTALRPIAKNEEILIDYGPDHLPRI